MLGAETRQRAETLHLTTVALFVLLWSMSHSPIDGLSAIIHHKGFWCNQGLYRAVRFGTDFHQPPPRESAQPALHPKQRGTARSDERGTVGMLAWL